jgi:2-polyprenyl-3-methyl-5-hydroxy-6-metoxy-1,4-benzoquinol methylase
LNTQTKAEFDQYARDYFKEMSHPLRNLIDPEGHYFIELKANILRRIASRYFGDRRNIRLVDVGTGVGLFEKFLSPTFANILAIDLSLKCSGLPKPPMNSPTLPAHTCKPMHSGSHSRMNQSI